MPKSPRHKQYALLAIGQKQLCWDDEFYRDVFLVKHGAKQVNGRVSASSMSIGQLFEAVEDMKLMGFQPQQKRTSDTVASLSNWRIPRINKIKALWHVLAAAGTVNQSEVSMQRWCARVSGKAKLEWAESVDLNNCIESLKAKAAREGIRLQH